LDFVGLSFKERVIEFFLAVSGFLFYHLILRPIHYWKSRKKEKVNSQTATKEVAKKNFSPSSPSRIEID
jgi:hypothetical protein